MDHSGNVFLVIKCKNKELLKEIQKDLIEREEDIFSLGEPIDESDATWRGATFPNVKNKLEFEEEEDFVESEENDEFGPSTSQEKQKTYNIFGKIKEEPADIEEQNGGTIKIGEEGIPALKLLGGMEDEKEEEVAVAESSRGSIVFDNRDSPPLPPIPPSTLAKIYGRQPKKTLNSYASKKVPLHEGSYTEKCKLCFNNIMFKKNSEWSLKCHHALWHTSNVTYQCPYCVSKEQIEKCFYKHLMQLYKHMKDQHNQGYQPITMPACREPSNRKKLLEAVAQCFPMTESQSLEMPAVSEYGPAVRSVMHYYVIFLAKKFPVQVKPKRPSRLVCTWCKTCISRGPLEESLKFDHALTHSDVKWITCMQVKCLDSFSEKEEFQKHAREKHGGRAKFITKDREDLCPDEVKHVSMLAKTCFPAYSYEESARDENYDIQEADFIKKELAEGLSDKSLETNPTEEESDISQEVSKLTSKITEEKPSRMDELPRRAAKRKAGF